MNAVGAYERSTKGNSRATITIDVLLESEDMWWGLLTLFDADVAIDPRDMTASDPMIRAIDALAWAAGARDLLQPCTSVG
jgi:hypothetical protein